jgi:sortase A
MQMFSGRFQAGSNGRAGRMKRLLSYPLLIAGAALLTLGAREVLQPVVSQHVAAQSFDAAVQAPVHVEAPAEAPLQRGDAVGKLTIPRLDAAFYVVEGDQADQLRQGPGHLRGSAMPGVQGNCVIAGHRDTHFRVLKNIRAGDDIVVETRSGQFLYRVKSMRVVSSRDTTPLQPSSYAELNLITCYPFYYVGAAPKRFVVQAQLAATISASSRVSPEQGPS